MILKIKPNCANLASRVKSKEEGKDQESIQVPHLTRATILESDKNTRKHHGSQGCNEQTRE